MELALTFILENSLVHNTDIPLINIEFQEHCDFLIISISDNGKGIVEEVRPDIFKPFFSTNKDSGSSGLGLSIARNIIETHGGAITLQPPSDTENAHTFVIQFNINFRT
jgi:signal transduction histidine kinase